MGHYASEMNYTSKLTFDEETKLIRKKQKRIADLFRNINFGFLINRNAEKLAKSVEENV